MQRYPDLLLSYQLLAEADGDAEIGAGETLQYGLIDSYDIPLKV